MIERACYTADEAAAYLRISKSTLWRLDRSGELKPARIGNRLRYPIDMLKRYLNRGSK